jgi:uncharacterized membrane protein YedE/YeeE
LHRGNVAGGVLFGIGWSLAGMCPGPILVNIGEGKVYALAALAGALTGAGAFGAGRSGFPSWDSGRETAEGDGAVARLRRRGALQREPAVAASS